MNITHALIDGPICAPHQSREDTVKRMAQRLVKYDAFRNEGDAIRTLMARAPLEQESFSPFDVLRFVDDARQVAMQDVVASLMRDSST